MILEGRLYKSGKFWLAEVPGMDAMTQGTSRADAIRMLQSLMCEMLEDIQGAKVEIAVAKNRVLAKVPETGAVIGLILRRLRARAGLTVREASNRLNSKSPNAYAAYEQGKREPSMSKLGELLAAVAPEQELVLTNSASAKKQVPSFRDSSSEVGTSPRK